MTKSRREEILIDSALTFVSVAAVPRAVYWLHWPVRLGARGFVAYVALTTTLHFLMGQFVLPYLQRMAQAQEQLKQRLGREPTKQELRELYADLGRRR
jgi:hypothetical protein